MLKAYLSHLWYAHNAHGLHSPFVYQLYTEIIRQKKNEAVFGEIESVRKQMKASTEIITIQDFGAGSKKNNAPQKSVGSIARRAEKAPKFGQLLFRLIRHFQPKTIFDLGTSLGITTCYEALAAPDATIFTFEGCPETANIARKNLEKYPNVNLIVGNLDETLTAQLDTITQLDFAFFDANHRLAPTLAYFEACLAKATTESVFVFDDIHWSEEMEAAWESIKAHPQVSVTIDLFFVGIVFFHPWQTKEHFRLRF